MAKTEVGGDNLGEPIPHDYLKQVQQEAESGVFIMPYGPSWGQDPMVQTPSQNYSVSELPSMFADLNLTQTGDLYDALQKKGLIAAQLDPPRVITHVMYSTGVDTELGFVYDTDFKGTTDVAPSKTVMGDGDGTVNLPSLQWAEHSWNGANFTLFHIKGIKHADTVKNAQFIARVASIVTH